MRGRKPYKFYRLKHQGSQNGKALYITVDTGTKHRKPIESLFWVDYPANNSNIYTYFYDNEHDELVFVLAKDDGKRFMFLNIFKYGVGGHQNSPWLIEMINDKIDRVLVFDEERNAVTKQSSLPFDEVFALKPIPLIEYLTEYID